MSKKIQMTTDVSAALFLQGQALVAAMEDEGVDQDTRSRIVYRANLTMSDVIDHDYQHVATINLSS